MQEGSKKLSNIISDVLEDFKKRPALYSAVGMAGLVCFGLYAYRSYYYSNNEKDINDSEKENLDKNKFDEKAVEKKQIAKNNQAGRDFFLNQTQITNNIKNLMPPKENLPETWNFPQKNKNFTGRHKLLDIIKTNFENSNDTLVLIACHGLGGIGKTQLVQQFVWRNYKDYKGVCWFSAENSEALILDYIGLGNEINLFNDDNLSSAERAKLVKTWLENNSGWLLIYDNVSKYEDIDYLFPTKGGKILITSRHTEWAGKKIAIDVFSQSEAQEYVTKITGIIDEPEGINKLIIELGALPLALAQASAYIKKMKEHDGGTIKDYLILYQKIKSKLLSENMLPTSDKHNCVALTWNITLKNMQEKFPDAVELLYFSCFFHHENIPQYILRFLFNEENEDLLTFKCSKAKSVAEEYSMITMNTEKKSFSLHCLVQETIKMQFLKEGKLLEYLRKSIDYLLKAYPYGEEKDQNSDIKLKRKLLRHFEEILKNLDENSEKLDLEKDRERLEIILNYLSSAYSSLGNAQRQKELLERALIIEEDHYGKDDYRVAITLGNLGTACGLLGDLQKSKDLLERTLTINENHYGKNHYMSASTLINLSNVYGQLGDMKKKKELLECALPIFEKHYGKDHCQIAIVLGSLGATWGFLGDVKKSKEFLECALHIFEKHYGNDHYKVAATLTNLGNVYGLSGNQHKKKELLKRALPIFEKHYGKDHYRVSIVLANLGDAYGSLDDVQKQKKILERALPIFEEYYGKNHQTPMKTKSILASISVRNVKDEKTLSSHQFWSKTKSDTNSELDNLLKKFQTKNENSIPSIEVALRRAAGFGLKEDVDYLIKKSNNINACSPTNGQIALHVAVTKGKKENVELLLAANANPDIKDSSGKTARDYDSNNLIEKYFLSFLTNAPKK